MTYHDLVLRLNDQPFRPFRIRLVNNTSYDIWEPWMIIVGDSSAVVVTETRTDERGHRIAAEWKTVSIQHMLEFSELKEPRRKGA